MAPSTSNPIIRGLLGSTALAGALAAVVWVAVVIGGRITASLRSVSIPPIAWYLTFLAVVLLVQWRLSANPTKRSTVQSVNLLELWSQLPSSRAILATLCFLALALFAPIPLEKEPIPVSPGDSSREPLWHRIGRAPSFQGQESTTHPSGRSAFRLLEALELEVELLSMRVRQLESQERSGSQRSLDLAVISREIHQLEQELRSQEPASLSLSALIRDIRQIDERITDLEALRSPPPVEPSAPSRDPDETDQPPN